MRGSVLLYPPIMAPPASGDRKEYGEDMPVELYVSYTKSIALEVEKAVRDRPPRRPAEFWRMFEQEINKARWRMRNVSGTFWKAKALGDQQL